MVVCGPELHRLTGSVRSVGSLSSQWDRRASSSSLSLIRSRRFTVNAAGGLALVVYDLRELVTAIKEAA